MWWSRGSTVSFKYVSVNGDAAQSLFRLISEDMTGQNRKLLVGIYTTVSIRDTAMKSELPCT